MRIQSISLTLGIAELAVAGLFAAAPADELVTAAAIGDLARVRLLVGQGTSVDSRSILDTPLTAAVRNGRDDVVEFLLKRGADPDLRYASGNPLTGRYDRGRPLFEAHCASCHASGKAPAFAGLLNRTMPDGTAPTYANILRRIDTGGAGMPAFAERLQPEEKADLITWLMRREDPLAGRTPAEIAAHSCRPELYHRLAPQKTRDWTGQEVLIHLTLLVCRQKQAGGQEQLAKSLRENLWYLHDRWTSWAGGVEPPPRPSYVEQLSSLEQLLQTPQPPEVWQALAEDLQIKADDCKAFGAARAAPIQIETLRRGQPVPGWQIQYEPKMLSALPGASPKPFPTLSSPARYSLPPGRYVMVAAEPDTNRKSQPQLITVGGPTPQEIWQIPVP